MTQTEVDSAVTGAILAQLAYHLDNADAALGNGDPLRASAEVGGAQLVLAALAHRLQAAS